MTSNNEMQSNIKFGGFLYVLSAVIILRGISMPFKIKESIDIIKIAFDSNANSYIIFSYLNFSYTVISSLLLCAVAICFFGKMSSFKSKLLLFIALDCIYKITLFIFINTYNNLNFKYINAELSGEIACYVFIFTVVHIYLNKSKRVAKTFK